MLAPSINIKRARSPGHLPGAASIGNRVTGLSPCMKNTALCDLIATSEDNCTSVGGSARQLPAGNATRAASSPAQRIRNEFLVWSITSFAEWYVDDCRANCDAHHVQ